MAVHTVAAPEAITLARKLGLDLELVQQTLDNSIAASAILKQRRPVMRARTWTPAPGPIATLHAILEKIADTSAALGAHTPVFSAAKTVFDKAMADGWAALDIAAVHDVVAVDALDTERTTP